jgi:hypothetical protein
MAEGDRLRRLQMREAGHHRRGVMFGQIDQCTSGLEVELQNAIDRIAQPQADIGGDLVVARAAGMQALAGIAHLARQRPLDVEMDVFVIQVPRETSVLEVSQNLAQAAPDMSNGVRRQSNGMDAV